MENRRDYVHGAITYAGDSLEAYCSEHGPYDYGSIGAREDYQYSNARRTIPVLLPTTLVYLFSEGITL